MVNTASTSSNFLTLEMLSIQMQHFLLRTYVRNYMNGKTWYLLHFVDGACAKYQHHAKFSTFGANPIGKAGNLTSLDEVEVVANRISKGSSEVEVFGCLVSDEACEEISLSHTLVGALLHRFKDDWKSAFGVFRWAESRPEFENLPETYDLMVDILGKARQFDKMRGLVGEMRERDLVSLQTVARMMRRFTGARQPKEAVRVFDELGTYGLEKNAESMNLLLDTLCKENRVEMARTIYFELKSHIAPTAHTFNIFIHGWCKIKRVEEAHWTLQEMKGHGFAPCVISYSIIIKSYCQLSNWSKVYELLEVMEAEGCQPSIITYTSIMSLLSKAGELEDALMIPDRVKSSGCKPDSIFHNALIHTLGKAQRLEDALGVFEVEMCRNGVTPNTETYNTLIAMFCYHGKEEMAFNILKSMEKSAASKPDLQTFDPLLKACFRISEIDSCLSKLLDDITSKHHLSLDASTYSLLIHGLCRVDRCEWALQLFEEMIHKELIPGYHTCRVLLDEVKQKNMFDAAERVADYIKQLRDSKWHKYPGSRASFVSIEV